MQSAKEKAPKSAYPGLTTPTVGAIHEMIVAADLLKRGIQVFRAVSASCDCDLAALLGNRLLRVEVTTGYLSNNDKLQYPKHDKAKHDVVAVCVAGAIHYLPPFEQWGLDELKPQGVALL